MGEPWTSDGRTSDRGLLLIWADSGAGETAYYQNMCSDGHPAKQA